MNRRNFVAMVAGLAAVPAAVKGLFVKQPETVTMGQHLGKTYIPDAIYLKELESTEERMAAIPYLEELTDFPELVLDAMHRKGFNIR